MNGSDIWMSLLIFFIFFLLFVFNIISVGIKRIKENWPQYRCNPTVMPFSQELGNISASENFTYCVQNMQADYMGIILQPVNYAISLAGTLAMDLISGINAIRHMFDFLREALGGIFGKIYEEVKEKLNADQLKNAEELINKLGFPLMIRNKSSPCASSKERISFFE